MSYLFIMTYLCGIDNVDICSLLRIFYYLPQWRHIVIALCVTRTPRNETAVDIISFHAVKIACCRLATERRVSNRGH